MIGGFLEKFASLLFRNGAYHRRFADDLPQRRVGKVAKGLITGPELMRDVVFDIRHLLVFRADVGNIFRLGDLIVQHLEIARGPTAMRYIIDEPPRFFISGCRSHPWRNLNDLTTPRPAFLGLAIAERRSRPLIQAAGVSSALVALSTESVSPALIQAMNSS